MAVTSQLEVVNIALSMLGERRLANLAGSDEITSQVNVHYSNVYDSVLGLHAWKSCQHRATLTELIGGAELTDWDYRYALPSATAAKHTVDVVCVADVAGNLGGKYFLISDRYATFYVWYDVDGGSTDPNPDDDYHGIEVDIITGETADNVASKSQLVLEAHANFSAAVVTDTVTITGAYIGAPVAAAGAETSGFTVTVDTPGVDPFCLRPVAMIDNANGTYADLQYQKWEAEGRTLLTNDDDAMIRYIGRIDEADLDGWVADLVAFELAHRMGQKLAGRRKRLDALGTFESRLLYTKQMDGRGRRAKREPQKRWDEYG